MPKEVDSTALEVADDILLGASFIPPRAMSPKCEKELELIRMHREALVKLQKQPRTPFRNVRWNHHNAWLTFHCEQFELHVQQIVC